jgi:hypothetical protein
LWAIKNHDVPNVLLALTPEQAKWYAAEAQRIGSYAKLFEHSRAFFGCKITSFSKTESIGDQELEAEIEIAPGVSPMTVNFEKIANEWKLTSLP